MTTDYLTDKSQEELLRIVSQIDNGECRVFAEAYINAYKGVPAATLNKALRDAARSMGITQPRAKALRKMTEEYIYAMCSAPEDSVLNKNLLKVPALSWGIKQALVALNIRTPSKIAEYLKSDYIAFPAEKPQEVTVLQSYLSGCGVQCIASGINLYPAPPYTDRTPLRVALTDTRTVNALGRNGIRTVGALKAHIAEHGGIDCFQVGEKSKEIIAKALEDGSLTTHDAPVTSGTVHALLKRQMVPTIIKSIAAHTGEDVDSVLDTLRDMLA